LIFAVLNQRLLQKRETEASFYVCNLLMVLILVSRLERKARNFSYRLMTETCAYSLRPLFLKRMYMMRVQSTRMYRAPVKVKVQLTKPVQRQ